MYYIYAHTRNDTGKIFYIGKGKLRRAWEKSNRNKYWRNITNKVSYSIEILAYFDSEHEALKQEINCIKWLDDLCNLTIGGDGTSGHKHSASHKLKILGIKNPKILSL